MNETKKDRMLRMFIIVVILGTLAAVFFYVFVINNENASGPLVKQNPTALISVIQLGDENNYPIVGVVKEEGEELLLSIYKIIPEEEFKFEMTAVKRLSTLPEHMIPTNEGIGLWLKIKDEWHRFNETLELVEKVQGLSVKDQNINFTSEKRNGKYHTIAKYGNEVVWEQDFEKKPISIHLISKNNNWIIVFQDEFVILR